MSDYSVIISNIISSMGLSGQEAERARIKLNQLTDKELSMIIANIQEYNQTDVGSFQFLNPGMQKFKDNIFSSQSGNNTSLTSFSDKSEPEIQKEYSNKQKQELNDFLGNFIYNSALEGYEIIADYNDSVGWADIPARVASGANIFAGNKGRIELEREMFQEQLAAQKLKFSTKNLSAFEKEIEKKYGVPYSYENIENLKKSSDEYIRVTAYHEKTENLKAGFEEVKRIMKIEQSREMTKQISPQAAGSLKELETSSDEKFAEVMFQFCNFDSELFAQYMDSLSVSCGGKKEIREKLPQIMDELIAKCEAQEKEALGDKTYSQYKLEYETACKKVMGNQNYQKTAADFVENAKTQSAYVELGLTVATTMLFPGTTVIKKGVGKGVGKAIGYIGKTFGPDLMHVGFSAASIATSEKGFTAESIEELKSQGKDAVIYGAFGSYVAGPLGSTVERYLSKTPGRLSNIVSQTMGAAAETSADTLFENLISDSSFLESLEQNSIMDLSSKVKTKLGRLFVSKTGNGHFSIKNTLGKEIFFAADEKSLAGFLVSEISENMA